MTEQAIEKEIQEKNLNAPRLTPDLIESKIVRTTFINGLAAANYMSGEPNKVGFKKMDGKYTPVFENAMDAALGTLTICILVLENGFIVTGESACASPENFDAEIGQKIARENARNKIWMLEGYLLKEKLAA
jgi:hypothetical protein